jgi:hypothetical protein
VFANGAALRRIYGPKREITRGWRKLHNEEIYNLYSAQNIVRVIKTKRIRVAGHVERMVEMRNVTIENVRRKIYRKT